ncbi:SIR2 family protein [Paraburkholderia sp. SIMBA_055]
MRFVENGPSISDELLLARDAGNVLFFCGAGVSRAQADLPDFASLAREVLDLLGSAMDSPARRLFDAAGAAEIATSINGLVAYDRIFGMLEREFEAADVREAVARALIPPRPCALDAHRTLLDLSSTRGGLVRIVTTNFDRLFEDCMPDLKSSSPPRLPDPAFEQDFHGIVHLHGVVDPEYRRARDDRFVLSSADFGHAYLSDGWATRYIQALLQRYRIVFVGYSADDPPVQYLLEALSRFGHPPHALYAFQSGDKEQAAQQWAHKGVEPITYGSSAGHALLWQTLARWAERARDVDRWYEGVIESAVKGPASMMPHERGIVAHLAATETGSRHLAGHRVVLPADWLFVFDRNARYGNPARSEDGDCDPFDPFEAYGLDSDPLPEPHDPENIYLQRTAPDVWDAMTVTPDDRDGVREAATARFRLRTGDVPELPARLADLGQWVIRIADHPATVWWAAKQLPLHPHIQERIVRSLQNEPDRYPAVVRTAWRLLLRSWQHRAPDPDMEKISVEKQAAIDGWTPEIVRSAIALYRPFLTVEATTHSKRPESNEDLALADLIRVAVEYPCPHESLELPDASLLLAVALFRQQLEEGLRLGDEIGHRDALFLDSITIDPADERIDSCFGIRAQLLTLTSMMTRLAHFDQSGARAEVARWSADDSVFTRLRIWAAGQAVLTSDDEAGHMFLALDDRSFWAHANQRDLLLALRNRWSDLQSATAVALEERLFRGHNPFGKDQPDRERIIAHYRLDRLQWLATHGANLSIDCLSAITELRSIAADWTEESARDAAQPDVSGARGIATDDSSEILEHLPLGEILQKAKNHGGYRFRDAVIRQPLSGLAKKRPARVLGAITVVARKGGFDPTAWRTLLHADAKMSRRLMRAIAHRLARLPSAQFAQITESATDWLCRYFQQLNADAPDALDVLWNAVLAALITEPTVTGASSNRSWVEQGMRSPVGRLTERWFEHPVLQAATPEAGLPAAWLQRLEALLAMPGDYRQHAIVITARRLNWLFHVAKDWSMRHLLPLSAQDADNDSGRAFWSGYLSGNANPQPALFREIKVSLLTLTCGPAPRRQEAARLANILLVAWGYHDRTREQDEGLSGHELREVLIHAGEEFCGSALWCLKQLAQMPETPFPIRLREFLQDVWPCQKALRTPKLSEKLVDLVTAIPDQFAELVKVVSPRLVPLRRQSTVLYDTNVMEKLVASSPRSVLDLLMGILDEDGANWPFSIGTVLLRLSEQEGISDDPRLVTLIRIDQRRRMP